MDKCSFYKRYLYYLISSNRNTRPYITNKNKKIYIPSPLSKCINANEIHLLYEYSNYTDSTYTDSTDTDSLDNFIIVGSESESDSDSDSESDELNSDILQYDDLFQNELFQNELFQN